MLFSLEKMCRASGHSLSILREEGFRNWSSRNWIGRICALTNSWFVFFLKGSVRMALLS